MARYLMNGVFIRDLAADRPSLGWPPLIEYAHLYYARYPALSLGHHPVLLPLLEAPLFAVFGISVSVARLIPLASLIAAVACLHSIVTRTYGPLAALAAAAIFVTSPMNVTFARSVMAEMPSIALVLASAYCLQRYGETGCRSALTGGAVAFVLALYAKPLTVLVAPALLAGALLVRSSPRALRRDVVLAAGMTGIAGAPAVALPLLLSPSNVTGVTSAVSFDSQSTFGTLLSTALERQLAWPVLVVAAVAVVWRIARWDRRSLLFLLWVASVVPALYFFGGLEAEGSRYTLYWVPALCALAGSLVAGWRGRAAPAAVAGVLAIGVTMQITDRRTITDHITQAGGYEEAARFVLSRSPGPTVLFSGDVDTGYFTFFVRKHDAARRLIVLRADKVYTTSKMWKTSFEDRIERPGDIYPVLHQFGTRYVVLEDRPSMSRVLEWLRHELKSPRFRERWRMPIRSTDPRLDGTDLVVFELLDATAPDPDALLSMHMPIVGQSLAVSLRDLIDQKLLR
jgi:hypothetical protein